MRYAQQVGICIISGSMCFHDYFRNTAVIQPKSFRSGNQISVIPIDPDAAAARRVQGKAVDYPFLIQSKRTRN
jgi:hypothetical protein